MFGSDRFRSAEWFDGQRFGIWYRVVSGVNSAAAPPRRRFGGYAALVAAGILLSRLAGLIRTRVFAHYLGSSWAADAYNMAIKVPNFLQNLLGEGVLSASFIPVYARSVAKGDEELSGRIAGVFVSFLALGVAVLVLFGVLFAPLILRITAPGFDAPTMALTITLVRIIFPGVGILVISAWCLGILNTHRQFFLSYVAPVLWNIAIIATLLVFGTRLRERELAVALAWGTVVGCVLQLGVQVPFVLRHAKRLSFGFDRGLEPVREIFRNLTPVVGGRGAVQFSGYIDTLIASLLPTGAVTNLIYGQTMYMLPISVFGMSVAAAELPAMSSEQGTDAEIAEALRTRMRRGLRQIAFFVIPTSVAFLLIGRLLVAALYQTGKFTGQTTLLVWYILCGSTVGLLVATLGRLYSSAFYALRDTRTPFRCALTRVTVGAGLGFLLAIPFRHLFAEAISASGLAIPRVAGGEAALGVVGITLGSAVGAWVEYLLLRRGIHRRIGSVSPETSFSVRLWIAAIAAGIAAMAFDRLVGAPLLTKWIFPYITEAIFAAAIFGLVYFGVAFLLGIPEARATIGRFLKR